MRIRPQIINLQTKRLELGEAKIVGKDILFNITPSPELQPVCKMLLMTQKKLFLSWVKSLALTNPVS